ncbi:MAG: glycosyltransferase [Litoreibacter sp.]
MSSPLRISVIIPHLNQPDFLRRCLTSLAQGTRQPDEIFVVDNGSDTLPEAVVENFEGVELLREPTPGPGPARNCGVEESTGDILAFIDADCLADPDWLAQIEQTFVRTTDAEILGGDVRIAYQDPDQLTVLEAYESVYAYRMDRYIAREGFTGTGNLATRRQIYEAVGPFGGLDVAEDRDWGQRATGAGHDLRYVPGMKVYHPARQTFLELKQKWDRHTAHDYALFRARSFGRVKWLARSLAMAVSPLVEGLRIAKSDRITGLRARLLAIWGVTRIRLYRARIMLALLISDDPDALTGRWNRG